MIETACRESDRVMHALDESACPVVNGKLYGCSTVYCEAWAIATLGVGPWASGIVGTRGGVVVWS